MIARPPARRGEKPERALIAHRHIKHDLSHCLEFALQLHYRDQRYSKQYSPSAGHLASELGVLERVYSI